MATTLFTDAQRAEVDDVLAPLVDSCLLAINAAAPRIKQMDKRPVGVYNLSDPNDGPELHRFEYVVQGMLEDLIERLQEQV